jgi:hypothetical protein
MTIAAGSVVIASDASETKSHLAEVIYDAFVDNYLTDTTVPLPGVPEALVPIKQGYATVGTRLAEGIIDYFHANLYTTEGGLLVTLTNKTGAASVKGSVVSASTGTDNAFMLQANRLDAIGIVYEDGIADGSECRVVIAGIADVLLEDAAGATHGDWMGAAATDGRAYSAAPPPPGAVAAHFYEVGHSLQTVAGGVDVLCRCILHFN